MNIRKVVVMSLPRMRNLRHAAAMAACLSAQLYPVAAHSSDVQDVQCAPGRALDPYLIWKGISGPTQARQFLRRKYMAIGSLDEFAMWLSCQSFDVKIARSGANKMVPKAVVIAAFVAGGKHRAPLWDEGVGFIFGIWPKLYAHNLRIYVDEGHRLSKITVEYTVE